MPLERGHPGRMVPREGFAREVNGGRKTSISSPKRMPDPAPPSVEGHTSNFLCAQRWPILSNPRTIARDCISMDVTTNFGTKYWHLVPSTRSVKERQGTKLDHIWPPSKIPADSGGIQLDSKQIRHSVVTLGEHNHGLKCTILNSFSCDITMQFSNKVRSYKLLPQRSTYLLLRISDAS